MHQITCYFLVGFFSDGFLGGTPVDGRCMQIREHTEKEGVGSGCSLDPLTCRSRLQGSLAHANAKSQLLPSLGPFNEEAPSDW